MASHINGQSKQCEKQLSKVVTINLLLYAQLQSVKKRLHSAVHTLSDLGDTLPPKNGEERLFYISLS